MTARTVAIALAFSAVLATARGLPLGGLCLLGAMPALAVGGLATIVGHDDGAKQAFTWSAKLVVLGLVLEAAGGVVRELLRNPNVVLGLVLAGVVATTVALAVLAVHVAARFSANEKPDRRVTRLPLRERAKLANPKPLPKRIEPFRRVGVRGDELNFLGRGRRS